MIRLLSIAVLAVAVLSLLASSSPAELPSSVTPLPPVLMPAQEAPPKPAPPDEIEALVDESWWYEPNYWYGPFWSGKLELGINGSSGNAESLSLRAGANLKRETQSHTLTVKATHAKTSSAGIETQNNALGDVKLERHFGDSPWSRFAAGSLEYDEFKAFDLRLAGSMGLGFRFIDNDCIPLATRFGAGVSHEIGGPDDRYVPEVVYGLDYEHQLTERQKLTATADYFPEWGDFRNYRLVTDVGWEVLLDEASNLTLKIGVIDRYDSTPNGRKPNDFDYSVLLLWKF